VAFGPVLAIPSGQSPHIRSAVLLGSAMTYSSSPQSVQALQLPALLAALYSPSAQAAQVRSLVAVPSVATYWPPTQSVQTVQLAALASALYSPAVHAAQVWSLVAVPSVATYWPATHDVQVTQAVAGSPSSSKVPCEHSAPGQLSPGRTQTPATQSKPDGQLSEAAHVKPQLSMLGE
jgi:hypothetical protein